MSRSGELPACRTINDMHSNPFSTRFIRPGAIPFVFPESESVQSLIELLAANRWYGQINGPHGSGKSTLLATLIPALTAAGRRAVHIVLHQGEHRLPRIERSTLGADTQLIIDGYEQLSWWARQRLKSMCQRHGAGLLVTTHSDMGLPLIFQTQPSRQLAQKIVEMILPAGSARLSADDLHRAFEATGGNLRETLFRLYDVYQQRR
jgi:hypothetical protein